MVVSPSCRRSRRFCRAGRTARGGGQGMIPGAPSPASHHLAVFIAGYLSACAIPELRSTRVIANLLTDNAFLGIVAVGMTFVIISGGIDLSVGSVIAFTGVFLAVTTEHYGLNPVAAFALILGLAARFGAGMGYMIHTFQIPAFIVTLAGHVSGPRPLLRADHPIDSDQRAALWRNHRHRVCGSPGEGD